MISLWLPWFSGNYSALGETSTGTISDTGDHGWLWLEFILALVLLVYLAAGPPGTGCRSGCPSRTRRC